MNENPNWLELVSSKIIDHMNDDHLNAIVSALNAQHGIKDINSKMCELKINGYYIMSGSKKYFIKFEKNCHNMSDYKEELIKQAKKYRKYEL